MIQSVVYNRMQLAGLTKAKLAEMSGCTATQMGIFINGNGFLSKNSLEKCFSILGIKIDIYDKRFQLAQNAASKLKGRENEEVIAMSKNEMVLLTGLQEISSLIDVSEDELDNIVKYGVVDYEGTFPYFKAMVLHLIQIGDNRSPRSVEKSFSKLFAALALVPAFHLFGITSVIGVATGLMMSNKIYSCLSSNALSPLMVLTKKIINIHKS